MTLSEPSPQETVRFLREADFGSPAELALRYTVVLGVGSLIWFKTGLGLLPFWMGAYTITELLYYLTIRKRAGRPSLRTAQAAQAAYLLTVASYSSLPIYMTHSDSPVMVGCALLGQLGMMIYVLWRPHNLPIIAVFYGVLMLAFATNVSVAFWDDMEVMWARIVFAVAAYAIAIYSIMTIYRALTLQRDGARREARSREAEKMESVGRLTGGVAHDFNNILTVVLGNLELYWQMPPGPERDQMIREAAQAATRGARLTGQLLAYSRKAPMAPRVAPLHDHLEEAMPLIRRLLPESIPLRLEIAQNAGNVAIDRTQFTAALLNLVSNAADAIGNRAGRITISGWPLVGPSGRRNVILSVADNGGGMSEDVAARALEPYYTTKGVGKGSGLGLPMVKGFAEQSGGRLELHNRPGEGVTVNIVLPAASKPTITASKPVMPVDRSHGSARPMPPAPGNARGGNDLPT